MRLYAALIAMLLSLSASAQFSEILEVRVLEIEATVLDSHGDPVDGLTREDFAVTIDGKPVAITNFFLVRRGAILDEARPATAGEPAPEAVSIVPTRLVIVVDDMHLHQGPKSRALEAVRRHLEKRMDAATTVSLFQWNGAAVTRVRATTNRDLLLKTLEAMKGEPAGAMQVDGDRRTILRLRDVLDPDAYHQVVLSFCESERRNGLRTIDGLREMLRVLQGMEGRKQVLFVSEGIPLFAGYEMLAQGSKSFPPDAMRYDQSPAFRHLTRTAQEAGVVFSTLDPSPTVAPMDGELDYKLMRDNARDSVTLLARQTGGQVIFDRNDFGEELSRLDEQVSTYYSIGVQPPASERKNVKVAVKVRGQPKLRVLTSTRRTLSSREEAVANAVRAHLYVREEVNPHEASAVVGTVARRDRRCVVPIAVEVPAQHLEVVPTQLDIRFAVLDDAEEESDVKTATSDVPAKRNVVLPLSLGLKNRKYVVSIAIVDRVTGNVSYLQRDVDCR